jgi:hypothetical protein
MKNGKENIICIARLAPSEPICRQAGSEYKRRHGNNSKALLTLINQILEEDIGDGR